MNLFKKAAIFTDIHFGLKSNSVLHNEDCLAFVKWATAKAREQGCETCLFLGDWHNNRSSLNIVTLNYSLRALEHMNEHFERVYFIPGNHDLYYRDKRDIQSVEWANTSLVFKSAMIGSATVMSLLPLGYVATIIDAWPK